MIDINQLMFDVDEGGKVYLILGPVKVQVCDAPHHFKDFYTYMRKILRRMRDEIEENYTQPNIPIVQLANQLCEFIERDQEIGKYTQEEADSLIGSVRCVGTQDGLYGAARRLGYRLTPWNKVLEHYEDGGYRLPLYVKECQKCKGEGIMIVPSQIASTGTKGVTCDKCDGSGNCKQPESGQPPVGLREMELTPEAIEQLDKIMKEPSTSKVEPKAVPDLGDERRRRLELTEEIKDAVATISDRVHDSQDWWSDYYADEHGATLIDQLAEKILRITKG